MDKVEHVLLKKRCSLIGDMQWTVKIEKEMLLKIV